MLQRRAAWVIDGFIHERKTGKRLFVFIVIGDGMEIKTDTSFQMLLM